LVIQHITRRKKKLVVKINIGRAKGHMKRRTFRVAKIISLIMGFVYVSGIIWFGEYYFTKPFYFILLFASNGLALIIAPLMTDAMLRLISVRVTIAMLVIIGSLSNIYMMIYILLTSQYFIDTAAGLIQQLIILVVLIIMLRRIINPHLED